MMGSGGKLDRIVLALAIGLFMASAFVITSAYTDLSTSSNMGFNVTPAFVRLNWTNDYQINVTFKVAPGNVTNITIDNTTTNINGNFSQRSFYYSTPAKYTTGLCFNTDSLYDSPLVVYNSTGGKTYITTTNPITGFATFNYTIQSVALCPPGKYWGTMTAYNTSDTSQDVNITVTLDVPITTSNILDTESYAGWFNGSMPMTATEYHSYYFNTSNVSNATSVMLNLIWSGVNDVDMDLFLFDGSGNVRGRSNNRVGAEDIYFGYLPKDEIWEIRVYGNITTSATNYNGNIRFSKINASYVSTPNERLEEVDLGTLNNTVYSKHKNISFTNLDGSMAVMVSSIDYSLYRERSISSNSSQNFSIIIPSSAQSVWIELNYSNTNIVNYSMTLYNPSGYVVNRSRGYSVPGNFTSAGKVDYIDVRSNNLTEGVWLINVTGNNLSNAVGYNITVRTYMTATDWLSGNVSSFYANSSGKNNNTVPFLLNFTVPGQNKAIAGIYKGYVQLNTNKSGIFRLPITANYTAANFMVNNTFNSTTIWLESNYNQNTSINLRIPLNNTGDQNMSITRHLNSSNVLNYNGYIMNMSYTYPTSIGMRNNDTLDVTIDMKTNWTNFQEGLYTGWIFLESNDSRPYRGFNVSIKVNLTSKLNLTIISLDTWNGNNTINNTQATSNRSANVTLKIGVRYLNGTPITSLVDSDFKVALQESNTSYRIPADGYLRTINTTSLLYQTSGEFYLLNFSVPANYSGGKYFVNVTVNFTARQTSSALFSKNTSYRYLIIERPGLYSTMSATSLTLLEGYATTSGQRLNVTFRNYGTVDATERLGLDYSTDSTDCGYVTISAHQCGASGSCGSTSGPEFSSILIPGNGGLSWYTFAFTAANITSQTVCTLKLNSSHPMLNNQTFTITINNNVGSGGDDDGSGVSGGSAGSNDDDTDTINYGLEITDFPEVIEILPGGTNTTNITVKNTGDISVGTKASASISEFTTEVTPELQSILSGKTKNFSFTFTAPDDIKLGEHTGTFKSMISLKTDVYDTQSFTIKVLPTEERKAEITADYDNYSVQFDTLFQNFTSLNSSRLVSIDNITYTEQLIIDTRAALDEAKAAIDSDDYSTAEDKLADVRSTMDRIKGKLTELQSEMYRTQEAAAGNLWIWAVIGIVIAAAIGMFIYMLMPPEDMKSRYSFRSGGGGFLSGLKNKLPKRKKEGTIKKAVKKYAGGYEKQRGVGYKFRKKK